jgi:hypothetical protein
MRPSLSCIFGAACFVTLAAAFVACGGINVSPDGGGGGSGGHAGKTGGAGSSGAAGSAGISGTGTAGMTGAAGATGTAGSTGSAGAMGTAGASGTAGAMGSAGATGSAGQGGTTGSAGHGGASGTAGATGGAGTGGTTGSAGAGGTAGTAGAGGTGGTTGSAGSGGAGTGGTCLRGKGCCANDLDCVAADECVGGTCSATVTSKGRCEPRPTMRNSCWSNADCKGLIATPSCSGASVCPCAANCLLPDKMGTCQKLLTPLADPSPATTN